MRPSLTTARVEDNRACRLRGVNEGECRAGADHTSWACARLYRCLREPNWENTTTGPRLTLDHPGPLIIQAGRRGRAGWPRSTPTAVRRLARRLIAVDRARLAEAVGPRVGLGLGHDLEGVGRERCRVGRQGRRAEQRATLAALNREPPRKPVAIACVARGCVASRAEGSVVDRGCHSTARRSRRARSATSRKNRAR